ncbi:unnamed protein product, partial [Mesorhabditis belari]|uniref:Uncharacterized protein n=1 Tax=Mesorhabditis belari TaxID=2138241 RepID=A0AAF3JAF1_9BILA
MTAYFPLRVMLFVQAIMGIFTIFLSLYTLSLYRKVYFHINCKFYHIIVLSMPPSCSSLVSPLQCLLMRGLANTCTYVFTPIHFALNLERVIARTRVLIKYAPIVQYQTLFIAINFVPYYTVMSNMVLVLLLKRLSRQKKADLEAHLRTYRDEQKIHTIYTFGW